MDALKQKPKTVDDFRTAIYETVGLLNMKRIDDIIEYIYDNRQLLDEWAKEYLV